MVKKVIILGSGEFFHTAQKILRTSPQYYVEAFDSSDSNFQSSHVLNKALSEQVAVIFCIGYSKIIKETHLSQVKFINFHPSILPEYRGRHSVVWAILNNEPYLGYTIHEIDRHLDSGPIIYQYKVKNDFQLNSQEFFDDFLTDLELNLISIITKYLDENINLTKQNNAFATWFPKRSAEDCKVDFSQSPEYYILLLRAIYPRYGKLFFSIANQKIYFFHFIYHKREVITPYGYLVNIDDESIWLTGNSGYYQIKLQHLDSDCSISKFKINQKIDRI